MRRLSVMLVALFAASSAFAVAPQFWRIRSAEDFLGGDIEGFAVTSRGELRPGPSARKPRIRRGLAQGSVVDVTGCGAAVVSQLAYF